MVVVFSKYFGRGIHLGQPRQVGGHAPPDEGDRGPRRAKGVPPVGAPPIGIGRGTTIERAIVDKNARIGDGARLTNERGLDQADGEGYYIRDGIIVVPKGATIDAGLTV